VLLAGLLAGALLIELLAGLLADALLPELLLIVLPAGFDAGALLPELLLVVLLAGLLAGALLIELLAGLLAGALLIELLLIELLAGLLADALLFAGVAVAAGAAAMLASASFLLFDLLVLLVDESLLAMLEPLEASASFLLFDLLVLLADESLLAMLDPLEASASFLLFDLLVLLADESLLAMLEPLEASASFLLFDLLVLLADESLPLAVLVLLAESESFLLFFFDFVVLVESCVLPLLACACKTTGIAASKNAVITHPARFFLSVIFILLSRPCEIIAIPISYCLGTKTPSATPTQMAPPLGTKNSHRRPRIMLCYRIQIVNRSFHEIIAAGRPPPHGIMLSTTVTSVFLLPRVRSRSAVLTFLSALLALSITALAQSPATNVAVGPQYDSTHVYVAPADISKFIASFIATFGGTVSAPVVTNVLPVPSSTQFQFLISPVGTLSVFAFQTPIPYPFGQERTGYLVTDMTAAVSAARAAGAEVIVNTWPDAIGTDTLIQFPGGLKTQLYWHTKPSSYPPLPSVPDNRVYISPDRADEFLRDFLRFSNGKIISDDPHADAGEIGRPHETYRRIRLTSLFGNMQVMVTDGHLPYPFGREITGYQVADLPATLAKARAAGATILSSPYKSSDRTSVIIQFPGGYIAEIHGPSSD
jgi:hypothetical protein